MFLGYLIYIITHKEAFLYSHHSGNAEITIISNVSIL